MRLISGPPLVGFYGLFEADYGDPSTEAGMPTIAPSFVGNSMLPFRCPACGEVPQQLACPKTREHYRDPRRGREDVHWCPLCSARFRLDEAGVPLPRALRAGATVAPSLVRRGGEVTWQDAPGMLEGVATVLGAIFLPKRRLKRGYWLLVRSPRIPR